MRYRHNHESYQIHPIVAASNSERTNHQCSKEFKSGEQGGKYHKFNQNCASYLLTPAQYKMLSILIMLLQFHKTVTIEKLATVFPQPIKFESRRLSIQRSLLLPQLSIQYIWFPLLIQEKQLIFAIDRTQWRCENVFVISLIEQKRAIPVYWLLLPKRRCSKRGEQKKLIRPLLWLFKGYRMLVLGEAGVSQYQSGELVTEQGNRLCATVKARHLYSTRKSIIPTVTIFDINSWYLVLPDRYSSD